MQNTQMTTCTIPITTLMATPFNLKWSDPVVAKVFARNSVGESAESVQGEGAFIMTVPDAPFNLKNDAEITSMNQVGLVWEQGNENGSKILSYEVQISENTSEQWTVFKTDITTAFTTITEISQGTTYNFRVVAVNSVGKSTPSQSITVTTLTDPTAEITNPSAPLQLQNVPAITNSNQIGLKWLPPLSNGGAPIVDYRISIKSQDDSVFTEFTYGVKTTSYTVKNIVEQGKTYQFKIEARNEAGFYGPFSAETLPILAAQQPAVPSAPLTVLQQDTVRVSWAAPDNGGSEITTYRVSIKTTEGDFVEDQAACKLLEPTQTFCDVSVNALTQQPFNLDWGSIVIAKVLAQNSYGSSEFSVQGGYAVLLTVPSAPTDLRKVSAETKAGQIGLTWNTPSSYGGA